MRILIFSNSKKFTYLPLGSYLNLLNHSILILTILNIIENPNMYLKKLKNKTTKPQNNHR